MAATASTQVFEQAAQALRQSPIPVLRRLRIEEIGDTLVISGYVPSYYFKQLAQETLLPLLHGTGLVNRVTVVPRRP